MHRSTATVSCSLPCTMLLSYPCVGPRVKLWSSFVVRGKNGYLDSWYISAKNLEL